MLDAVEKTAAGEKRNARLLRDRTRAVLRAELADVLGTRADEDDAFAREALGEGGVLGEEAVARMDRLSAALARGGDDLVDVEVGLRDASRAEPHHAVGRAHRRREAVGVGGDADRLDLEPLQCADDARGDLAAVGNKDRAKHLL